MKDHAKLALTPRALKAMTPEQFAALQRTLADGNWDTCDEVNIWEEWGTIMVSPKLEGSTLILMGIEKDGYTHS